MTNSMFLHYTKITNELKWVFFENHICVLQIVPNILKKKKNQQLTRQYQVRWLDDKQE